MKAATGELNLTVITIVAIGAVIAFFMAVLWPAIQGSINDSWSDVDSEGYDKNTGLRPNASMITGNGLFEFTSGDYTMTVK